MTAGLAGPQHPALAGLRARLCSVHQARPAKLWSALHGRKAEHPFCFSACPTLCVSLMHCVRSARPRPPYGRGAGPCVVPLPRWLWSCDCCPHGACQ
jgi:hypothetical protein